MRVSLHASFTPLAKGNFHHVEAMVVLLREGVAVNPMVPHAFVAEAHARLRGRSELISYECGHFDLYVGPVQAENARRQGDFLARCLRAPTDAQAVRRAWVRGRTFASQ